MASRKEGTTLGPYRILEQVGQGGMATVYKAYQPSMDRTIALKILPAYYAQDPRFVERFKREARTIARLEHKNILPVHDFGEENGITYLVMRYLDGGTLKDMLALGRLTVHDAIEIMTQICAALDYAHRQGVVHRDVKPANIMVDRECSAYLTDFGIAKVLEGVPGLTETGAAVGTPAYMAPEQALGKPVDARTDIYALGVILYEMILGRPPFQADTPMAVALAHIHEPLPLPRQIDPSVSEEIENVILKALAKDPDDRYQTASEMAGALKEASASAGVTSASSTLRSLATQASDQIAGQTLKVSPEMFAQAHPTIREAAVPPQRGLSPVAIGGIAAGVVVVLGIVGAILVLVKPEGASTGSVGASTEPVRASTEPVSATVEPTSLPYIYDSFDNPAYDGSFDPSLWFTPPWEERCDRSQAQGSMVVSNDPEDKNIDCRLSVSHPTRVSPAELGMLQARLKFSQTSTQGGSNSSLALRGYKSTGDNLLWMANCGLAADQSGVWAYFEIQNVAEDSYSFQESARREWPAESERWYTIQLKTDPETMVITCLVDGQLLATAAPDNAIGVEDQLLERGLEDWRSPSSVAVSHADDFTILPPGQ